MLNFDKIYAIKIKSLNNLINTSIVLDVQKKRRERDTKEVKKKDVEDLVEFFVLISALQKIGMF